MNALGRVDTALRRRASLAFHSIWVMRGLPTSAMLGARRWRALGTAGASVRRSEEGPMADTQVVSSIPESALAADAAVVTLKDSALAKHDAIGILVLDEYGKVKTHKVGSHSFYRGAGIGFYTSAAPDAASVFAGWSADCSGAASCQVRMDLAGSVTATFARKPRANAVLTARLNRQLYPLSSSVRAASKSPSRAAAAAVDRGKRS